MAGAHSKSPLTLRAEMILGKARAIQGMTPEQLLDCARGELADTKINMGYKIGFGLALIELMYYWQTPDDELKDFIDRHAEFLEAYGSTDKEDKAKILDLFNELDERTGFKVIMDKAKQEYGNNS